MRKQIQISLTGPEAKALDAIAVAYGLTRSAYVRSLLLQHALTLRPDTIPEADKLIDQSREDGHAGS